MKDKDERSTSNERPPVKIPAPDGKDKMTVANQVTRERPSLGTPRGGTSASKDERGEGEPDSRVWSFGFAIATSVCLCGCSSARSQARAPRSLSLTLRPATASLASHGRCCWRIRQVRYFLMRSNFSPLHFVFLPLRFACFDNSNIRVPSVGSSDFVLFSFLRVVPWDPPAPPQARGRTL